jgi:TMEM189-like protein
MSSPTLGASSLSKKVTTIGASAACVALLAVHGAALFAMRDAIALRQLLWLGLAPLLADILSGLLHWAADTRGSESTPILGPRFIRPFRVHHLNADDILSRPFFDLNGDVALVIVPMLALAFLAPPPLRLFLVALAVCILPTNQIHQWAHRPDPPRFVRLLQSCRLILPRSEHQLHHTEPHRSHYCITTGWANGMFDRALALGSPRTALRSRLAAGRSEQTAASRTTDN